MFWFGAIVSLCYLPGVTGAYIATQWPVLAAALSFCLLVRVAASILGLPTFSGPFTVLHGVGVLFFGYAAVHFVYPVPQYDGVFGLALIAVMCLSVWFGSTLTTTRELYKGLAFGAAVSSAVAVSQYFGVHTVYTANAEMNRLPGIYVNAVQQGTVLALLVIALLTERMWLWALPLVPGLVLANTRGAWLMLAVGLLGLRMRRLWVFGLLGAVGAVYLVLLPLSSSDNERLSIWAGAWVNLTWFGWGPGTFYMLVLNDDTHRWFPEYAHNDALQLLFEYGVGAVLPFAIFGFALYCTDAKEWPVVITFVVAGCYSMPLFMPLASFIVLVAVGRIVRDHGMVFVNRDSRRQGFLERQPSSKKLRGGAVPLEPAHSAASR